MLYNYNRGIVVHILPFGVISAYLLLSAGIFCLAAWLVGREVDPVQDGGTYCLAAGLVVLFFIQCGEAFPVMIKRERLDYRCDRRPMVERI